MLDEVDVTGEMDLWRKGGLRGRELDLEHDVFARWKRVVRR